MEHGHGNRTRPSTPDKHQPTVRKVPADRVPFGESISRNGRYVYAAYNPGTEQLVCIAATAPEARRKYRERMRQGGGVKS
jgi:hypothetical protein